MGGYRGGRVDSCLKGRTGGHRGGWVDGWTGGRVDKNGWIAQLISTKMLLCFCFCHVVSLSDRYCHLQDLEYVEKSGKKGQRRTSHISQQEKKKNTMMVQILNRTIFGRFGRSAHGSKYLSIFIVIYIFVHLVIFH